MIKIDQSKITQAIAQELIDCCPFGAIALDEEGKLQIGEGCRLCKQCLKRDAVGALALEDGEKKVVGQWKGICVLGEFLGGQLHPVTLELLGKAKELAAGSGPVSVILPGYGVGDAAKLICEYGADTVYTYDDASLSGFEPLRFTACIADCIRRIRPAVVMAGATVAGRSLAPRLAARFQTGLTADCTVLSMREGEELIQTRPAFGGNVMAQIITKAARPQMCTVRYRVFERPARQIGRQGKIVPMEIPPLDSGIELIRSALKQGGKDLSEAEAIVAVGRGCASRKNIEDAKRLAQLLGAEVGCTRPMVESGAFDPRCQIGLSGRTVKPRFLIALGISGSVQFAAGMEGTELIIAINNDPAASIFSIAHVGLCCDAGEALPLIIAKIEQEKAMEKGAGK